MPTRWFVLVLMFGAFLPTTILAQARPIRYRAVSNTGGQFYHLVEFWRDETRLYYQGRRGFNIALIDTLTGGLRGGVNAFDTWDPNRNGINMRRMIDSLNTWPNGALLLIAVSDEAGLNQWNRCDFYTDPWVTEALQLLEELGSRLIRSYCYRYSWAMITVKGQGRALGEAVSTAVWQEVTAEATVVSPVEPTTWGQIKVTYSENRSSP